MGARPERGAGASGSQPGQTLGACSIFLSHSVHQTVDAAPCPFQGQFFFFVLFFLFFYFFTHSLSLSRLVVFVHVLLFGDGVPLWKTRQKGFEVMTSTLGEFDEGLRSSAKSPAILLNAMASKDLIHEFFKDYDGFLQPVIANLKELIKGKPFYCEHLKKVVHVVAVFHGFEADLIERYKAGGSCSLSFPLLSSIDCGMQLGLFIRRLQAGEQALQALLQCVSQPALSHL